MCQWGWGAGTAPGLPGPAPTSHLLEWVAPGPGLRLPVLSLLTRIGSPVPGLPAAGDLPGQGRQACQRDY